MRRSPVPPHQPGQGKAGRRKSGQPGGGATAQQRAKSDSLWMNSDELSECGELESELEADGTITACSIRPLCSSIGDMNSSIKVNHFDFLFRGTGILYTLVCTYATLSECENNRNKYFSISSYTSPMLSLSFIFLF